MKKTKNKEKCVSLCVDSWLLKSVNGNTNNQDDFSMQCQHGRISK